MLENQFVTALKSYGDVNAAAIDLYEVFLKAFDEVADISGLYSNIFGLFFHDLMVHFTGILIQRESSREYKDKVMFPWVSRGDAQRVKGRVEDHFKSLKKGAAHLVADFDPGEIGKRKGGPMTHDPEDKNIMGHFGQGELHDMTEIAKQAFFRVGALGDLRAFLQRNDGKLVHKSTNDLWSYAKDAEGGFIVSRLFDDTGEPLKG